MRAFRWFRKAHKKPNFEARAEPNRRYFYSKHVKTGISYADIVNLPMPASANVQDPVTGKLLFMVDYDAPL